VNADENLTSGECGDNATWSNFKMKQGGKCNMQNFRKRVAVVLALIMLIPYVCTCISRTTLTSVASTSSNTSLQWVDEMITETGKAKLTMEVGQSVEICGLYIYYDEYETAYTGGFMDGKYFSSNNKVVNIDKNGIMTAKKTGKARIVCKYKDKKISCSVTVVKKGSIEGISSKKINSKIEKFQKKVASLDKVMKKGITKKNCYSIYNKIMTLHDIWAEIVDYRDSDDYKYGDRYIEDEGFYRVPYKSTYEIAVPEYFTYQRIYAEMHNYIYGDYYRSTGVAVEFVSKKITSTKNKAVITLENKVTKEQFFRTQACNSPYYDKLDTSAKTVKTSIAVYKYKNNELVGYAKVKITFGSNKIKVTFEDELPKGTYRFSQGGNIVISGKFTVK
jgi:hypothetical protein